MMPDTSPAYDQVLAFVDTFPPERHPIVAVGPTEMRWQHALSIHDLKALLDETARLRKERDELGRQVNAKRRVIRKLNIELERGRKGVWS